MFFKCTEPDWLGFNYRKTFKEAESFVSDLSRNLYDIKDIGGYTYSEMTQMLNLPVWSIKRYIHNTARANRHNRLDISRQYFIALWAKYLREHIPPKYYVRKRRQQRQRAYRERLKQNTTIRIVKGH